MNLARQGRSSTLPRLYSANLYIKVSLGRVTVNGESKVQAVPRVCFYLARALNFRSP